MANIDKNQAVIDFLLECPLIQANPTYFNFANAKDNNKQIATTANERLLHRPYIDGSVMKRYTFTIIDYKSVSYNAIARLTGYTDENVEEMFQVQELINWITDQEDAKNYPDFGSDCIIEKMEAVTDNPRLDGIDTTVQPALAKYSVSIQIDYIDYSKLIWK